MQKWLRLLVVTGTLLLLLAFVAVVVHLGMLIHHTLLLFALGALVAYALNPLVERIHGFPLNRSRATLSREISVLAVFLGLLLLAGLAVWGMEGSLARQVALVRRDIPTYHAQLLERAGQLDQWLGAHGIHTEVEATIEHPPKEVTAAGGQVARQVLPFVTHALTDIGESVIILLIALYFLLFAPEMREQFNALLPPDLRRRANLWETDVSGILGGFVRGQLLIALATGGAAAAGCLALGLKPWLLLGLFVVVTSLVPVFGPYIGAIPAVVTALVSPTHIHSPAGGAVVVLVYFVIINELASKVLYPKLVGKALGLHTVLVLFVLFAGLELAGVPGVFFAAPLTSLVIVTIVHLYRLWQDLPDNLLSDGESSGDQSSNGQSSDGAAEG